MQFGQLFDSEPGNMVGPTKQGMDDLIDRDPNAYWDESNSASEHDASEPARRRLPL